MQYDGNNSESAGLSAVAECTDKPGAVEVASPPPPRLSLLRVNFAELYERHLCRHSQYGINVSHLATVVGCYLGVFGLLGRVIEAPWPLLTIPLVYLAILAINAPARLLAACALFMGLFFALFLSLPTWPVWLSVGLIVLSHQVQNWSHRWWNKERDMTKFQAKYRKGPFLFTLLSLYELPILLNYLIFGRKDWTA
jgi:hypothetical protein